MAMHPTSVVQPDSPALAVTRLGVVSFLNTRPIISGLEGHDDLELKSAVPSELIDHVIDGDVDVALCSSIDYLRSSSPLRVLGVAPLTCDGPTLTVRVFSSRPLPEINRVFCDVDSHTSIALLRILSREALSIDPELVEFDARANREHWPETVMLIGDKVVRQAPTMETHPYQVDLGEAWKDLTGLPFVFALWMARGDACEAMLAHVTRSLSECLASNLAGLDQLVEREAASHGWPQDLAARYLNGLIRYQLGPQERMGLQTFFELAVRHELAGTARPLDIFEC